MTDPQMEAVREILAACLAAWRAGWIWPVAALVGAVVVGVVARATGFPAGPRGRRVIGWGGLAAALGLGLAFAWSEQSLLDDAFISFRYAKNLLAGHGLVFNIGERVEGYTNFLWTLGLAGVAAVTRVEIPLVAFFGSLASFVANLVVIGLIGRRLSAPEPGQCHVPLAALWLAVQYHFHEYGTTGLETMFASLLVNSAVLARLVLGRGRGNAAAGALLILATLTRPDHALFYAVGAAVLVAEHVPTLWRERRRRVALVASVKALCLESLAYAAPFLVYVVYLGWKFVYYGSLVPNTYYAYSASESYWSQGLIYGLITLLAGHWWVVLPMFGLWLATGPDAHAQWFKRFAGLGVAAFVIYVLKIGGDKMASRFFITVMPLVMLGVEQWLHRLARRSDRRPAWAAIAAVALLAATTHGFALLKSGETRWGVCDSPTAYSLVTRRPVRVSRNDRTRVPRRFNELLPGRGIETVFAAGGIGIPGYYLDLPLVDRNGLTDAVVAHLPLEKRGRVGHERRAPSAYLDARQVRFLQYTPKGIRATFGQVRLDDRRTRFFLWRYDNRLVQQMRERAPEIGFVDFPAYLDKETPGLVNHSPLEVAKLLAEFDHYYFAINHDPARRAPFVRRFVRLWDFEDQRFPAGTAAEGAFAQRLPFIHPEADADYQVRGHQGDSVLGTPATGRWTGTVTFPPFTIEGDVLGFLFAGGKRRSAQARLIVDGQVVARASGRGDSHLRWVTWPVTKFQGRTATVVVEDASRKTRVLFDMFFEAMVNAPPAESDPL